ncbi:MAG TPA: amino acid racemase [Longimicrobium sp.]
MGAFPRLRRMGVLGGLGPQATMEFEARVHAVSRTLLPSRKSGGYPPMAVLYYRHTPFLLDCDLRVALPPRPHPRLLEAARSLRPLADFLVIPANAPHLFHAEIEEAFGGPLVSMVEATLAEVERRGWTRVGVLGLGEPRVYLDPLGARGVDALSLPPEGRAALDAAIFATMEGGAEPQSRRAALDAVAWLRARGADGIIPGCTEVPLLLGEAAGAPDLVDPLQLLAEAAVRYAIPDEWRPDPETDAALSTPAPAERASSGAAAPA